MTKDEIRAVPDVPELVRYDQYVDGNEVSMQEDSEGLYVLHSQATEIIVALSDRLKNTETAMGSIIDERIEATKRAEAAEAKLAQYETQLQKLDDTDKERK